MTHTVKHHSLTGPILFNIFLYHVYCLEQGRSAAGGDPMKSVSIHEHY